MMTMLRGPLYAIIGSVRNTIREVAVDRVGEHAWMRAMHLTYGRIHNHRIYPPAKVTREITIMRTSKDPDATPR